eukprot:879142-Prorocentrum_minimum.AAC.2
MPGICGLPFFPNSAGAHLFEVLAPLVAAVALADLDAKDLHVRHEGSDASQRLPPAAADTYQQGVAEGLPQHAADARDVHRRVQKQHQVHPRLHLHNHK